ncbi:MAG: hypothetical protein M1835_006346, partial [Candelina submexicana]
MTTDEQKQARKAALETLRRKASEKEMAKNGLVRNAGKSSKGRKRLRDEFNDEAPAGKRQKTKSNTAEEASKASKVPAAPKERHEPVTSERDIFHFLRQQSQRNLEKYRNRNNVAALGNTRVMNTEKALNEPSYSKSEQQAEKIGKRARDEGGDSAPTQKKQKVSELPSSSAYKQKGTKRPSGHSEDSQGPPKKLKSSQEISKPRCSVAEDNSRPSASVYTGTGRPSALKSNGNRVVKINTAKTDEEIENTVLRTNRGNGPAGTKHSRMSNLHSEGKSAKAKEPSNNIKPCPVSAVSLGDETQKSASRGNAQSRERQHSPKQSSGNQRPDALADKDINRKVQKRKASEAFGLNDKDRPVEQPAGLQNHHFACYSNAVFQCVHGVSPVSSDLESRSSKVPPEVTNCGVSEESIRRFGRRTSRRDKKKKEAIRDAFKSMHGAMPIRAYTSKLFRSMSKSSSPGTVSPFLLQQAYAQCRPGFDGDTSQDAHQFLAEFLGMLEAEERREDKVARDDTIVRKTLGGQTATKFCCSACGHQYQRVQDFLCLNLDISKRVKQTSLGACWTSLPNRETLEDYKCSNVRGNGTDRGCGRAGKVEKITYLKKVPDYLAVHLERMVGTSKLETKVTFPTGVLDLSQWAGPEPELRTEALEYEVIGIVEHRGQSSDNGHYTAIRKIDGKWWLLDDDIVKELSEEEVKQRQDGYLFFLRK